MPTKKTTMGLIIGNRGFFPYHLAKTGRDEMMRAIERAGMECVVLAPGQSKHRAVETHEEARRCAALLRMR
jgi:L-fucose isomerase-like protein